MRQTVLIAVVATLLITSAPHTAKAFFPISALLLEQGWSGAQCRTIRIEGNKASKASKATKANNTNEAKAPRKANHTKRTTRAKHQNRNRDDSKIAKESPPKAKSHESVANAPQAKPLTAGAPPTPDKFGE